MNSNSPAPFDPYHQWLGIPPGEQPPDYYRLLGLARFESSRERIEAAAGERMSLVCKHLIGPQAALALPLLSELAAARECLLSPEARAAYDGRLRPVSTSAVPLARVVALPAAAPPPPPVAMAPGPASSERTIQATESDDNPPTSLWSFVLMAVGMAVALLVVALGTYGIGRLIWSRKPTADLPAKKVPAEEISPQEVNPGERPARQQPERSRQPHKNVVVLQEGSQDVNLTPATAVLTGSVKLKPTGGDELLDGWSQPGDQALWTFKLLRPGFFRLAVTYAALDEAGETTVTALVNDTPVKTYTLRPTGNLDEVRTAEQTIAMTTGGEHTLAIRLDDPVESGCLVLKVVRLAPVAAGAGEK